MCINCDVICWTVGTERQDVAAESEHIKYPHIHMTSCSEGSASENADSDHGEPQSDFLHTLESKGKAISWCF